MPIIVQKADAPMTPRERQLIEAIANTLVIAISGSLPVGPENLANARQQALESLRALFQDVTFAIAASG